MIEIQLIFRPSDVEYKPGVLIYRLIHNRVVRQYLTDYRIFPSEWNEDSCCIELYNPVCNRSDYLLDVTQKINIDINNLKLITKEVCENNCNNGGKVIDQVLSIFKDRKKKPIMMFEYMYMVIENVRKMGHIRLSETYLSTLNSLKRFSNGVDFKIEQLDSDLVSAYEVYLKKKNLSSNTTSFYMRNLRSIYNRAVASGLVLQTNPFRYVYSGVAKTAKRTLLKEEVQLLKNTHFSDVFESFARDMFMFSFYTRGMSFVDMAYLKKDDVLKGELVYVRRKTGQRMVLKWEKCMEEIVEKYSNPYSEYLLPIISNESENTRKQYLYMSHKINIALSKIGRELNFQKHLTMYVARHSWASIAKRNNIPISVISEGMGHTSESVTRIYLSQIEGTNVDKANQFIINLIG